MLYQKILTDDMPYQIMLNRLYAFGDHRHADIEFQYAVKGGFDVTVEKKTYHINEGELSLIGSGVSHSFPESDNKDRLVLTGIVGTSFLKRQFASFESSFSYKIIKLDENIRDRQELKVVLDETVKLYKERATDKGSLLISSNFYRIAAFLLSELDEPSDSEENTGINLRTVSSIEKALDLIYYDYKKDITVDDAASVTGYGKSNFCKIFKRITGNSFHKALNMRRISVAKRLLTETDMTVTSISDDVGFTETKTFCRVFKEEEGLTPAVYRKQNR